MASDVKSSFVRIFSSTSGAGLEAEINKYLTSVNDQRLTIHDIEYRVAVNHCTIHSAIIWLSSY